jgi:hypothetical protein
MAVTVDGPNRLFILSAGTILMDVKDIFSRWKDWVLLSDNSKYQQAFDSVGGQEIDPGASTSIPAYVFLLNGWRIRPQENNHTLNVSGGVILVSGGGDPFVNTLGSFVVRVNYQQPVQAITVATGGGGGVTVPAIWQHVIEAGMTAEEFLRIMLSVLAGKVSGAGSGTESFRDVADAKNRVVSTVDTEGNRTAVILDGA